MLRGDVVIVGNDGVLGYIRCRVERRVFVIPIHHLRNLPVLSGQSTPQASLASPRDDDDDENYNDEGEDSDRQHARADARDGVDAADERVLDEEVPHDADEQGE